MQQKKKLGFWQIWNISFGFLGIQFGWGLEMGNMSAIYEYLGASPEKIPILWLAAPMTGLIIQPIIGWMSDNTWGAFGRRRPYFLIGAILSSLSLVFMPHCSALWMAAGLLWILDASINVSMEPFRAFVSDMLPEEQRTLGFVMQSFFIGFGQVIASALPWMMEHFFKVQQHSGAQEAIPLVVRYSFYIGAGALLTAVLWTILTTKEYPPEDMETFRKRKAEGGGFGKGLRSILTSFMEMPQTMRQLAWVQIFTWLGLFCMWLYFPVAVAHNIFGATDEKTILYTQGIEFAGICFSVYSAVCFLISLLLAPLAKAIGRKATHSLALFCGALGLLSVAFIHNKYLLFVSMTGVGVAWASILSMPYAILAGSLPPERTGVYMGIFNFFITLPEIIAALFFGWIMAHWFGNNRLYAVIAGGASLMIASILVLRVRDVGAENLKWIRAET